LVAVGVEEHLVDAVAVRVGQLLLVLLEHLELRVAVLLELGHPAGLDVAQLHLDELATVVAQDVPPDDDAGAALVADDDSGTECEGWEHSAEKPNRRGPSGNTGGRRDAVRVGRYRATKLTIFPGT